MGTSEKFLAVFLLLSLAVSTAVAPASEPRHPLSQIQPVDIDLNMSEQDIINITRLALRNGITVQGTDIRGPGNTDRIRVNPNGSGNVVFPNGDIYLNGNKIGNPSSVVFENADGSGAKYKLEERSGTGDFFIRNTNSGNNIWSINGAGAVSQSGRLNIQGNPLTGVNQVRDQSSDVRLNAKDSGPLEVKNSALEIKDGPLNLSLYGDVSKKGIILRQENPKIFFHDPNVVQKWEIFESGGDFYIKETDSNTVSDIRLEPKNKIVADAPLDLNGQKLTGVGSTQCAGNEFIDGNGLCVQDSNISDDQRLKDVLSRGNSAGSYNIDMNGQNINNVNAVDLSSTGDIRSDGTDAIRLDASQNVEVPRGRLDVPTSKITVGPSATSNTVELNSTSSAGTRLLIDNSNNGAEQFGLVTGRTANEISISRFDGSGNFLSKALAIDTSSNVRVPNGKIKANGGSILLNNENLLESDEGLKVGTCGSDNCIDHSNNGLHLNHNNGNNVYIGHNGGGLGMRGLINMNGNSINLANNIRFSDQDGDGNNWDISGASNGHLKWTSVGGGGTQMDLEHNGNLRIEGSLTEGASLDVAENMKKKDLEEKIEPGDVVGIKNGEVTRNTSDAALNMVVSASPGIVLGGKDLGLKEEEKERFENRYLSIAFTGRVPVKVKGEADEGDYLVPSGENDGTAVAIDDEKASFDQYREAIGVVLGKFEVPENVNEETAEKYRELLQKAENEPYSVYNVAVGVK